LPQLPSIGLILHHAEAIQTEAIKRLARNTVDYLRKELWPAAGEPTMENPVREEVHRIVEAHRPESLDGCVLDKIARLKREGEKELLDRLEKG
jgi:hypothetical protein